MVHAQSSLTKANEVSTGAKVDFTIQKDVLNETVYPIPILIIFSDTMVRLISAILDAMDVVAVEQVSASAPNAHEIHIAGSDHQSLTDLRLASPLLVSVMTCSVKKAGSGEAAFKYYVNEKMDDLVLKFSNTYLKGERSFTGVKTY